jgi:hypothetical protein
MKVDKAKRKTAGYTCMTLFHLTMNLGHTLQSVARPVRYDEGNRPLMGTRNYMGQGLTPKERKILEDRAGALLKISGELRLMGQRFLK